MANATPETVQTVWYRNVETGVDWEVVKGTPLEKRLRRELTDDADNPENRYERIPAPTAPAPAGPSLEDTREELDAAALAAGVPEPEKLPNKQAVLAAIAAAQSTTPAG